MKPCNERKKPLHEKVAIVTGSTYGIGFAIARRLAQDGAHVLLCSRKQHNVDKAAEQLKGEGLSVYAMVCHVGNKEDREKLVATAIEVFGKIDILVCNAAVNPFIGPIFDTTEDMWTKVFHINVISTFFMIKLVVPHMQKQGGGSIILCSSFLGYIPQPMRKTPEFESKWNAVGVNRLGEPEECAGIASFLCSDDASYINGENIAVAGGMQGRL
ncbi:dehydrogenase/reductase SDR family member 4-like isoform 2-T3 [Anomaloglossus baeobatrachus]